MTAGQQAGAIRPAASRPPGAAPAVLRRLARNRVAVLLLILALYNLVFAVLRPASFLSLDNYLSILVNMSIESFIVIGITILLVTGNLDLSLGANMALSGILCGLLIKYSHLGLGEILAVTLVASIAMGAVNGYVIAYVGVNPIITTLATAFAYQGVAVWLAGPGFTDFPDYFKVYGQSRWLGVQGPVWYMLGITALFHLLLSNAPFFRNFYFVGGSKRGAAMSGIPVARTVFSAFVIAAVLANLAGVVTASRFNSSMTSIGTGVELRAVTAAVIGGVAFTGGSGTILGAVLGALFLAFVNNGLILLGVEPSWQNVVVGIILILSIVIDVATRRRR
ncbi:MAG TPA: ABC transporter permease [Anaeromyxobacter sp.]|nr:ABC transporter permease [Anaeromyxobacter sp.]